MPIESSIKLLIWLYRQTCASWWALEPCIRSFQESGWDGVQKMIRTPQNFWSFSSRWEEFSSQRKLSLEHTAERLKDLLRFTTWQEIEADWAQKNEVLVTYLDAQYPDRLREIEDPPPVFWCSQELSSSLWNTVIAVVGSRRSSIYGDRLTEYFVESLVQQSGATIVSGCAVGIDTRAHLSCLEAGGITVGVLGVELGRAPQRVRRIFSHPNAILVSEWPPDFGGESWNFARRNRLISGLSQGVLVIEAQEKSGTMLTVNAALEQGREVFVPPHSLWSKNVAGVVKLANAGAKLVLSARDIFGEFSSPILPAEPLTAVEDCILETVRAADGEMLFADLSLAKPDTIPSSEWWQALQSLDQKGMLKNRMGVLSLP